MDQLVCVSLSHIHYKYEVGMLKVPAFKSRTKKPAYIFSTKFGLAKLETYPLLHSGKRVIGNIHRDSSRQALITQESTWAMGLNEDMSLTVLPQGVAEMEYSSKTVAFGMYLFCENPKNR